MRTIRVLLAEDNEDHAFLIVRALGNLQGIRLDVEAVRDGDEALDYIYRRGSFAGRPLPHLMILDLKMPKIGGLEVLERLKQDPELRTIPIIVLTASDRVEDIEGAYKLGANTYLVKPITEGAMREEIEELSRYWAELATLPEPPK